MIKLNQLSGLERRRRLCNNKLALRVGPFVYQVHSSLLELDDGLGTLYGDFEVVDCDSFVDFTVSVKRANPLSYLKGTADFYFDHQRPFTTFNIKNAYAFFEWGLNWCISVYPNEYLKLHAGVVAKEGRATIFPGVPGAGKSTLCAALGLAGWRVLSDEHALIPPKTSTVVPVPRPVSLKNESLEVIRRFSSDAVIGPPSGDTHKGRVAHLKSDLTADAHERNPLPVHSMVFPQYSPTDEQHLSRRSQTQSFVMAAFHSFNYSELGMEGFLTMRTLIDAVRCYDLVYRDLDWAIDTMEKLNVGMLR